jgi:hypothetical protein
MRLTGVKIVTEKEQQAGRSEASVRSQKTHNNPMLLKIRSFASRITREHRAEALLVNLGEIKIVWGPKICTHIFT